MNSSLVGISFWFMFVATATLALDGQLIASEQPDKCSLDIVETNPKGMVAHEANNPVPIKPFEGNILDTLQVYLNLLAKAKKSIKIASFYWNLTEDERIAEVNRNFTDPDNSQMVGQEVLDALRSASNDRQVNIEIATDSSQAMGRILSFYNDLQEIEKIATVHYVNMTRMFEEGVLHTKFIIVDDEEFYLGSANMDWRSLTQVRELGFYVRQCPRLTSDLVRVFESYKRLTTSVNNLAGEPTNNSMNDNDQRNQLRASVRQINTSEYNRGKPLEVGLNNEMASVYLTTSPDKLTGSGRSTDLEAIIGSIKEANKFVYLTAMEYGDMIRFSHPKNVEWLTLFNALDEAKKRGLDVRILSDMHKMRDMPAAKLKQAGIEYRGFVVPKYNDYQKNLPFSRLYHSKYVVTDKTVIVTTQNMSPDYFIATLGVSMVINDNMDLVEKIKHLFERDFNSSYASHYVPRPRVDYKPKPF